MKTSSLITCIACTCFLLFIQCKKDNPTNNTTTVNFSPSSNGSNWNYLYKEGNASVTVKVTATNKDTTINNKTYKIYVSDSNDTTYMTKSGNDYYRFQSFPSIGVKDFEELYLKDNVEVNGTWNGTTTVKFENFDVAINLNYTLKGKGETKIVEGKTYNNVTHVRLDIITAFGNLGGGDFFYAEGIGMIDDYILVTPPTIIGGSPYSSTQTLLSYEIK